MSDQQGYNVAREHRYPDQMVGNSAISAERVAYNHEPEAPYPTETAIPGNPNKIYDINITQVDYGYIVKVGCQTVVVENVDSLIGRLAEYLKNPRETQEKYNNKELFK